MSLTDARRMWKLLNEAESAGCHSHDLRKQGVSGNPSQRAKDIVSKGQRIFTARESRNGRPGSRYWLDGWQPDWSVPVKANGADGGDGCDSSLAPPAVAPVDAEPWVLAFDGTTGKWSHEPAEGHWAVAS